MKPAFTTLPPVTMTITVNSLMLKADQKPEDLIQKPTEAHTFTPLLLRTARHKHVV